MGRLAPLTPSPPLRTLLEDPEVDVLKYGLPLGDNMYVHIEEPALASAQTAPHNLGPNFSLSQAFVLPSLEGQQAEMQAPEQVSCTLTVSSSFSVSYGTSLPGERSIDVSSRPDPLEQIFKHLNEMENRLCNIQAVIPLAYGSIVQGEGVVSPSLT